MGKNPEAELMAREIKVQYFWSEWLYYVLPNDHCIGAKRLKTNIQNCLQITFKVPKYKYRILLKRTKFTEIRPSILDLF